MSGIEIDYDLIGFSIISYYELYPALLIADWIKRKKDDVRIVFGGPYASLYWRLFFEDFHIVDYLIEGAGELSLLRLINYLEGKNTVEEVPGITEQQFAVVVDARLVVGSTRDR